MPTFKPVVSAHQRRADGSYNIKIRVTHRRVSRWLATNLTAYPSDLTRTLNIKNKSLEYRCNDLIREMRSCIEDISTFVLNEKDVDWVVDYIKKKMKGDEFHLDFIAFGREYIAATKTVGNTAQAYKSSLNTLVRFLGRESIDINEITHAMLIQLMDYVDKTPKMCKGRESTKMKLEGGGQSSRIVMKLSHIYQKAKERYNDEDAGIFNIPRNPFANLPTKFPASTTGQRALSQELMQTIILAEASEADRIALDVFVLSFCLMGANLADLYEAKPQQGKWLYNRRKTRSRRDDKARMEVDIPAEAEVIIERLRDGDEWWLGKLHKRCSDISNATHYVNKALRRWGETQGMPDFTFYAARKTWATIARKAGIEKATIDECLCHIGDMKMADIYIEKDFDIINNANRVVLAQFTWPTKG